MKDYDPNKPSKFIQYLDANNLYGWAMSQKLPRSGFTWMTKNQLTVNNVIKILNGSTTNKGYVFEVDLEYPKRLWKKHNDYPLAPRKMECNGSNVKLFSSFLPKK